MKLPFAPDEAAHYRKTARRDESGRREKEEKTRKMPLSQVRLPGDEGKSERERKEREKIFTRVVKSVTMMSKVKPMRMIRKKIV